MPANKDNKDLNVDQLIGEAIETIDTLIKSENEKLKTLSKTEESSKESSKAEQSKPEQSVKKDEMSSSPAPEASSSPAAPPQESSPAPDQSQADPNQQPDDGADLQGLVSSLDDGMLQELMQVVQMELESRQSSQQQAPPEQSSDQIAPAPEASQQMAPADMAMKSEFEAMKEKLAKSEEKFANLEASVLTITETITKSASKPRPKAVTEIKDVQVVNRGEDLSKKEKNSQPTPAEVFKKMDSMAKDRYVLSSLNKGEMDTLQGYFSNKQINDKVLQLFNK
jgi:hypothetical protein